jgi:hypothetical protein
MQRSILLGSVAIFLTLSLPATGSDNNAEALTGISGFCVDYLPSVTIAYEMDPDAKEKYMEDITREFEEMLELELRKAGIKVYDLDAWAKTPDAALLNLYEVAIIDRNTMTTAILLEVRHLVTARPSGNIVYASIWRTMELSILGVHAAQRTNGTKQQVQGMMVEFLNEYLAANPKK